MAPEEESRARQSEYTLYRSRRRAAGAPGDEPNRRSLGDLIIRAGAVAAAIASIATVVALVWPDSPARQGAKLSNVSQERNVSLAEFAARQQFAALDPRDARGRLAQELRGIGPPGLDVVLVASAEVPPEGTDTAPEPGTDTAPEPGIDTAPEPGTDTAPEDSADTAPEDSADTATPEDDRDTTPEDKTLQGALESVIPPSYDLNPTCDEAEPSCSPPPEITEIVLGLQGDGVEDSGDAGGGYDGGGYGYDGYDGQEEPGDGDGGGGVGGGDVGGGDGAATTETEPLQTARQLLRVLRNTRVRTSPSDSGSGGNEEVLGVTVSFDLELEGFEGRHSHVRWSLYDARGKRRVPRDWLINRRVLSLQGKANEDRASKEFWVPLPRRKGPFFVRVGVYDDDGTRLTYEDTKPFR